MFTDSNIIDATVATVSESQVGSISVPAGRSYRLTGIWAGHPQGGTCRVSIDTFPALQGKYIQNSTDIDSIANANVFGSPSPTPLNINVNGPAEISAFVTNAGATTGTARVMFNYIDSGAGATN